MDGRISLNNVNKSFMLSFNFSQRCSLATKDLNRQWSSPNSTLFPTIYHTKGLIAYLSTCTNRPITVNIKKSRFFVSRFQLYFV